MNTGIPRNQNDGIYDTYGDAQGDKLSLREGHVIYVRSASLYAEVVTTVTPYPITGSNPSLYIQPQNTTPGTGETNTGSNIGLGEGVFAQKSGTDLQFYSHVSQYGLESRLINDTYYRGLNPFVADNVDAFYGSLRSLRNSKINTIGRSGRIESFSENLPAYGGEGLSCMPAYTNSLLHSEALDDSYWQKQQCTISANQSTAPDGTNTMDKIVSNNVQGQRISVRAPDTPFSTGDIVNILVYVKAAEWDKCIVFINGANISKPYKGSNVKIDITEGAVHSGDASLVSLKSLADGILEVRIRDEVTSDGNLSPISIVPLSSFTDGLNSVTGDGVSGIYAWGMQSVEVSADVPYIKTESAMSAVSGDVNRLLKINNVPKQGGSFCIVADVNMYHAENNGGAVQWGGVDAFKLVNVDKNICQISTDNGVDIIGATNLVSNEVERLTLRYDGDVASMFKNGVLVESKSLKGKPVYSLDFDIEFGKNLNNNLKIKKWLVNEILTDQQISDLGGPENVVL